MDGKTLQPISRHDRSIIYIGVVALTLLIMCIIMVLIFSLLLLVSLIVQVHK